MSTMADWKQAMSQGYWDRWNDDVQAKIDRDIEANRKADGVFKTQAPKGADVKVEQTSSSFIFGAHIFNFDQLGTDERNAKYRKRNAKYRNLYGTLFNSATIAFYWKTLEFIEGQPRFEPAFRDTAAFWNNCPNPKEQPHWRRPAVDPVVEFCLSKGIRLHGHTIVWGNNTWQYPDWLMNSVPFDVLKHAKLDRNPQNNRLAGNALAPCFEDMTADEFADRFPEFTTRLNTVMPGDYTYRAFKIAESVFPAKAKLNINDYNMTDAYLNQVQDLLSRKCKIDIMGAQMHLFNPQTCLDIADGKTETESPSVVYEKFSRLEKAGLPIHLSEITITAPNNDERGQAIQAVITRNLYRLWFSLKPMMGITSMNDLINHEWRTNTCVKADADGNVSFRGFRGNYKLTWLDAQNNECSETVILN